ncbi:MAG: hypothetical protein WDM96_04760 [Lacunisphaera sp.]
MKKFSLFGLCLLLLSARGADTAATTHVLTVEGTRFRMDGQPFPFTGYTFFNAVFNPAFNQSSAIRRQWLAKFQHYGINVIRIWCQWDGRPAICGCRPGQHDVRVGRQPARGAAAHAQGDPRRHQRGRHGRGADVFRPRKLAGGHPPLAGSR